MSGTPPPANDPTTEQTDDLPTGERTPPPANAEDATPITAIDLRAAITEAMKQLSEGFTAQIGELRSMQQAFQDQFTRPSVRQQLFPTSQHDQSTPQGVTRGQTATLVGSTMTPPESVNAELLQLRHELKQLTSRVERRDHPTSEIENAIARTDSSPFTPRLNAVPLKEQITIRLPYYNGTENPSNWLSTFKFAMKRQTYTSVLEQEANFCHVFSEHLTKSALTWFTGLPSGSIDSFKDLATKFLQHYSMLMTKSNLDLFTMQQEQDETLRKYMDRFKAALTDHAEVADELKLKALERGVWYRSEFSKSLQLNPPSTLQEALQRAQSYILLEDNTSFNDQKYKPAKSQTPVPKPETKAEAKPKVSRPTSYAVQKPSTFASSSLRPSNQWHRGDPTLSAAKISVYDEDHSQTCAFHKRTGHSTESCRHLTEKLFDLYHAGAVKVDAGPSEARIRSRSDAERRRENRIAADKRRAEAEAEDAAQVAALAPAEEAAKRDREEPDAENRDLPPPPRRRILMIMGGLPDCDDTVSAIQTYERKATSARRNPGMINPGPTIYFEPRDAHGLHTPHNDPLVVELSIQNCEVTKILIDTGSNVNLIFKDTLSKMGISEEDIKPSAKPLTGFTGNYFFCIGTIYLAICAGGVTKTMKFTVMDKPAIYNVILGTPWIHEMKGVVSTYHQCMKFPIPTGIFTLRGSQQAARSCYLSERRLRSASACMINEEMDPRLPNQERPKPHQTFEIKLDEKHPERVVSIGAELDENIQLELEQLLREHVGIFAWSMADMKGINPKIASHELNIDSTFKPIKQKRRKLGTEKAEAVNAEVEKLLAAGSIAEVKYPDWLANPVVVKKKNGKWRVCVDFTDLNKACPKDSFPLPHIDRLVEATAGNQLLSFMDAFSGYNQIFMHPDDREKTAFITDRGTYCYKVMPFGLKNAGATYQRLVNKMFAKQLGKSMEVYIDDMLVKSAVAADHIQHLRECFQILDEFGMKLNPTKCTFAVTSGEFLGYIVTQRGIEANPRQIKAIMDLPSPEIPKDVQRLTGRIAALNRFISRSTDKCLPFYKILKGNKAFDWDKKCEEAFRQLKIYLTTPPVLAKPEDGETLFLYVAISSSAVSGVLVREDRGEQKPIFYVSKTLDGAETRYPTLEKLALAIVTSARKLRPYFQSHSIVVLTGQPIRAVLHSPSVSGRMAKWAVELSEYDIEYKNRTCAKSQVLADFLVEIPPELVEPTETPGTRWNLHVDGGSSKKGAGLGIRLVSPTGEVLEQSIRLAFHASNNEAEYEALIAGLRLAKGVGATSVQAYCDSQLVANQFSGEYEAKNERMDAYLKQVQELAKTFSTFELTKIPRAENTSADALAALATTTDSALRRTIPVETIDSPSIDLPYGSCNAVLNDDTEPVRTSNPKNNDASETEPWQNQFREYLINGTVPANRWAARRLRRKAAHYFLHDGELFRWTANKVVLRCCNEAEAQNAMSDLHDGELGNHSGGRSLALKLKKHGVFWPTMMRDCEEYTLKCIPCQKYAPIIHAPTEELQSSIPPYPFMRWAMDAIGPMPPARQFKYVLLVTDYFTKWVEARPMAEVTALRTQNFIWEQVICRHGVPYEIVTDNAKPFVAKSFKDFCSKWNIRLSYSTPAYPQSNGQAESTNKTVIDGIKKKLTTHKGAWADELDGVLWAHRTTPKSSTGETPFSLSHGCEALAPIETTTPTIRRSYMTRYPDENDKALLNNLDFAEELRDQALIRMQNFQQMAARQYNKKVRSRLFSLHDLVLKKVIDFTRPENKGKFGFSWEGPYLIYEIVKPGVYKLQSLNGEKLTSPWNSIHLKKYYA